jgi:hypothetical protein
VTGSNVGSEADNFSRGNKRDPTAYPELKDRAQFREWKRNVRALAIKDDCYDVLDKDYTPS